MYNTYIHGSCLAIRRAGPAFFSSLSTLHYGRTISTISSLTAAGSVSVGPGVLGHKGRSRYDSFAKSDSRTTETRMLFSPYFSSPSRPSPPSRKEEAVTVPFSRKPVHSNNMCNGVMQAADSGAAHPPLSSEICALL